MASRVEPSRVMSWAASSEPWRLPLTYFFACPFHYSLFTVHCSRMFSQQINTTFDTSLLCPQRNRINSSHAPRIIPQPQIHLSSTFGTSSCSSCVLRLATPSSVMVSKVLGHSSFDRLPSSALALALVVARGPRLKPAWPVDTFA